MVNEKRLDLIDRQALGIGRCNPDAFPLQNRGYCAGWNGVISLLEQAPRVDAVEVVHGKAVHIPASFEPDDLTIRMDRLCSECGALITQMDNYCPNCGAKMDGGVQNA